VPLFSGVSDTAKSKLSGVIDTTDSKFSSVHDTIEYKISGIIDTAESAKTPLNQFYFQLLKALISLNRKSNQIQTTVNHTIQGLRGKSLKIEG
jgi:hypothetical protein